MQRQLSLLRRLCKLARIILSMYLSDVDLDLNRKLPIFTDHLCHLTETRGIAFTVSYVKASRNAVMRHISGEPLSESPGVQLKDGWPVWLSDFKDWTDDNKKVKALLTLLTLTRAISLEPSLDLNPIVSP